MRAHIAVMTTTAPAPAMQNNESPATLTERAAAIGPAIAEHAARHDADGTFVTEAYDALRAAGLLKAAVPTELGGDGATVAELTALQRELAHYCGSTALASSMHQHVVAFTAWRYRRGLPGSRGHPPPGRRRGDPARLDRWWRLHAPPRRRGQGRRRLPGVGAQALRQPVRQRQRDVDDVRLRRPDRGSPGAQRGGPDRRRGRHASRTTGTPSACAAPRATTSWSRTSSCPTSGCWPTGRTASSTSRCR